jgi:hypothetical protein
MARKKTAQMVRYVSPPASRPAPIVVRMPRAPAAPKKKHHRRHASGGGTNEWIGAVVGGAALGFIDKQGTAIPTVPLLGRAGTIALVCYIFRGKNKWIAEVGKAAASVAMYEQISQGSISGIASQT